MSYMVSQRLRRELASVLGAGVGAGLVKLDATLNYAAGTIGAALTHGCINVKDFPWLAKGDGVTDDTAAIQAAINHAKTANGKYDVYAPEGVYRLTAQLLLDAAVRLIGAGVSPYEGTIGTMGGGTWLYFDHAGKGVVIDGTSLMSGVSLTHLGTVRNQPVPGPGWTPNAHDYDIYIDNADVLIDDVTLLNPTKGVFLTNGQAGRLEIGTLRGHAFQTMLRVDTSYDVVKINNLHQWPFWRDDANVHAYTLQNLDTLYMERCDNPMVGNLFSIFHRAGIRFGQNANGKTSKIHLVNADFDRCKMGLWVDNTVTTGVTGQFVNVTYQRENALAASKGVFIEGSFCEFGIVNFASAGSGDQAIKVSGSGNKLDLAGRVVARYYDQSAGNVAAIEADNGNTIEINGYPDISNGGGTGGRYGGNGDIRVDEWRAYAPTVTATAGAITTLGAVSGQFKRFGNTVDVALDISITTNGTGAGAVRATLPTASNAQHVINGRDVNIGGKGLTGSINFGTANVDIRNYDNTYPAADGSRLIVNGSYRIA